MNETDVDNAFEEGFRSGKPDAATAISRSAIGLLGGAARIKVPEGYRYTENGNLEHIPGGPVDPTMRRERGEREYMDATSKGGPYVGYSSFSDKELKEMDKMKAGLQKGYEGQFLRFNRGEPLTQRQKDHAEDAAVMAAAREMMSKQANAQLRLESGAAIAADEYPRKQIGIVGDAAVRAVQDNRKK